MTGFFILMYDLHPLSIKDLFFKIISNELNHNRIIFSDECFVVSFQHMQMTLTSNNLKRTIDIKNENMSDIIFCNNNILYNFF